MDEPNIQIIIKDDMSPIELLILSPINDIQITKLKEWVDIMIRKNRAVIVKNLKNEAHTKEAEI